MRKTITITQSIFIRKPREEVWDFTQNYDNRTRWDNNVISATTLQYSPRREVRLRTKGKTEMTFVYKLDNRPDKTTLVAKDIRSPLVEEAGGSWTYLEHEDGTIWEQTNTIILRQSLFTRLLTPILKWTFSKQTKRAMARAKTIMEQM